MASAFGHHAGQQAHRDPQRAKIVQLHGAFIVVKTVVAGLNGTANGTPCVVDQEVNAAVHFFQRFGKRSATFGIRNIDRIGKHLGVFTGEGHDFLFGFGQFVFAASANDGDSSCLGKLARCRQANTR